MRKEKIRKVVIPAGGNGTRFLPITKAQPKEMLPVVDKPVIQYVVEEAIRSGIDDILIITGKNKRAIEDHFDKSPEYAQSFTKHHAEGTNDLMLNFDEWPDIQYVRQKTQRGLGDAILHAKHHCDDEPFAVLLGDTITMPTKGIRTCTSQLIDGFERFGSSTVAIEPVRVENLSKYGIIRGNPLEKNFYDIQEIVEKPTAITAPSNLGIIGRYILVPEIFDAIKETLPGYGGEIQLSDSLNLLDRRMGQLTDCVRYDIGDKISWMKASMTLALEREDFSCELLPFLQDLCNKTTSKSNYHSNNLGNYSQSLPLPKNEGIQT